MAIRPMRPCRSTLSDGRVVTLRQVAKGDVAEIIQAFDRLSADTRYARFLHHKSELRADEVELALRPRPGVAFVIVATVPAPDGIDIVGAAQYLPDGEGQSTICEFAITVADDWHGTGLGRRLLASVIRRARRDGYATMRGMVLAGNHAMLALARKLKFTIGPNTDDASVVFVSRSLVPIRRPSSRSKVVAGV